MTPLSRARRFIGIHEVPGPEDHPLIQWWLSLCRWMPPFDAADEIPWCSAFLNGICWDLELRRTKSARARSWLRLPDVVNSLSEAVPGWDILILKRGGGDQPGPEVIQASGHVGFYVGHSHPLPSEKLGPTITVLGGNQGDEVNIRTYPMARLLGVRRLAA